MRIRKLILLTITFILIIPSSHGMSENYDNNYVLNQENEDNWIFSVTSDPRSVYDNHHYFVEGFIVNENGEAFKMSDDPYDFWYDRFQLEIFWHNDDLDDDPYFAEYLFDIIQSKLGQEYTIERVYANGQTAMQCGTPHFDDGDMTFLYYANKEWEPFWQGHLIFMENEMETSQMVSYKPNRAVLFPGNILHYADAPSRFFNGLRISLAYKLWN